MPARLILNADDFGLTRGVNRAIAELHAAGVLPSTTLMAAGAAFDDAIAVARSLPTLGVGCHIVLTDGIPVLPPETLPTLCPNRRTFRPKLTNFLRDVLLGRIDETEVQRESLAQIEKLKSAGIQPTHVDTHKHTHIFPQIARPLLNACEAAGVRAIRHPFEPLWSVAVSSSPIKRQLKVRATRILEPRFLSLPQIRNGLVRTTNGTIGISATGDLNVATLSATLNGLPDEGTYELLCHPGYNDGDLDVITTRLRDHRDIERQALLNEIPRIFSLPSGFSLINYSDL